MAAARAGEIVAPVDLRYLSKGLPAQNSNNSSRTRIVSFLRGIYESVAETLPDIKDEPGSGVDVTAITLGDPEIEDDPYVKALTDDTILTKQKHQRKRRFNLCLNTSRTKDSEEVRWLPPGHIRDFYEQMCVTESRSIDERPPAFSTFWRVWHEDFSFLKFRPTSSHAMCSTCLRHKLLIRGMSGHMKARVVQIEHYASHLRSQYNDRLRYYDLRGICRLRNLTEVLLIQDGMDQAKFTYPRSDLISESKELAGMPRPRAHITGAVAHGFLVLFTISPADLPKDANTSIETTAHILHLLSKQMSLARVSLTIQADNTSREIKNNIYLRWIASLVSHGALPKD